MEIIEAIDLIQDHPGNNPLATAARVVAGEYLNLRHHLDELNGYVARIEKALDEQEETE
jgi:hypothetical protein